MAYSKAPTQDTYSQHTLPVCYNYSPIRGDNSGLFSGIHNLVPIENQPSQETEKSLIAKLRPRLVGLTFDTGNTAGLVARGCYVWQKTASAVYYYVVFGTRVYTSTDGITWVHKHTLTTNATTPVGFCEFIDSATNTKTLVLVDGVQGFTFATDAAGTEITDAQFPTPHLPFPVYLDGYLFLAKPDTGDIYNSDLNNEESWTAGNFISSELYADDIKAIVKVDNWLVAIGSQGSEYFYDAANATSSPLRRMDGASLPFGTYWPYSIAVNKDTLVMLANFNDGEPSIVVVKKQEYKDVSPPFLMPILSDALSSSLGSSSAESVRGCFGKFNGHLYYHLNTKAMSVTQTTFGSYNFSFLYNLSLNFWSATSIGNSDGGSVSTTQKLFPIHGTCSGSSAFPTTFCCGNIGNAPFFARWGYTYDDISGYTIGIGSDVLKDINAASYGFYIYWKIVTAPLTFGTLNNKFMSRLAVSAFSNLLNGEVNVRWSDDLGSTSDLGTRRAFYYQMDGTTRRTPYLTQLGDFRRRTLVLDGTTLGGDTLQFIGIEVDINKGIQ